MENALTDNTDSIWNVQYSTLWTNHLQRPKSVNQNLVEDDNSIE